MRDSAPERYEVYTSTIQKRLPRFRLPLAQNAKDAVVDLQTCLAAAAYSSYFKFSTDRVIAKSASAGDVIFADGFGL